MDQKPIVSLITYNTVQGFQPGWYEGEEKRVFIHANPDDARGAETGSGDNDKERAQAVMASLRHSYYGKLEVPIEEVEHYYVYAGLNAMRAALEMARTLRCLSGAPVTVCACDCNWSEKKTVLANTDIELIQCECGGEKTLGRLAEKLLM